VDGLDVGKCVSPGSEGDAEGFVGVGVKDGVAVGVELSGLCDGNDKEGLDEGV